MRTRIRLAAAVAALAAITIVTTTVLTGEEGARAAATDRYEVWYLDQTDSRPGYGGFLHIHGGPSLETAGSSSTPETIDLGGAVSDFCRERTGANPVRPHMLAFNGGDVLSVDKGRFAIISWVASGHVTIHDARTRETLACLRTTPGAGGARQAHAAWPTPDERYLVVANQNGKLIQRIRTDYANRQFTLEESATLDLVNGTTPNGAPLQAAGVRPDNAPICVRPTYYDRGFSFVSLRGGGAFVIDHNATPMRIVAEYDKAAVDDNGCGQIESRGRMFFNAGATGQPSDVDGHSVYSVELDDLRLRGTAPNQPPVKRLYNRAGPVDAHGFALVRGGRHVLVADRQANDLSVVDTDTQQLLTRFTLRGPLTEDPAPDLISPSPDGTYVFATFRGPSPLSGGHPATGTTPGLGVIKLDPRGPGGRLVGLAPARRPDERAPDPHGVGVRMNFPPPEDATFKATPTLQRSIPLSALRRDGITLRVLVNRAATIRAELRVSSATARRLGTRRVLGRDRARTARTDEPPLTIELSRAAAEALEGERRVNAEVAWVAVDRNGKRLAGTLPVRLRR